MALLELFTSEGCSSCPPAEAWLSAERDDPGLWREFVPVSWHVNYWDNLGWKDRFSSPAFTERQYRYREAWRADTVYTPCFVRDGREWQPRAGFAGASNAPGVLTVTYDGANVRAEWSPAAAAATGAKPVEIHVALLGAGVRSKVAAGENRGATLTHDFVALALVHGPADRDIALPSRPVAGVERYALAAWVTRRGDPTPLQATGGWLPAQR